MRRLASLFVVGLFAAAACGPTTNGNGSGSGSGVDASTSNNPDAYVGALGTVTGKVWMPHYSPGVAPPGQEIPVFGAVITLTGSKLDPIPQQVYCEQCVNTPGAVSSGHDGSFVITAPPGDYWLTIQKGQFRLEQQIHVDTSTINLPDASTTLPSQNDPANGAWIPKVAIAVGNYDAVEDILGKIGFGTMDGTNEDMTSPAGEHGDEVTLYEYPTGVQNLLSDLNAMRQYHIIFFPCSTSVDDSLLSQEAILKNIRQYVSEGGKLYVTDWSGETSDRAFPPQIQLGGGVFGSTDTVGTYDPKTFAGNITTYGVLIGTDMQGQPVYDQPKGWIDGTGGDGSNRHPMSVTYSPTGCGRVLYSTYQTSGASASDKHAGLMAQERVLLFLIMEIGVCSDVIVVN
ncbi:MAG: hypothetical protein K8W52_14030 [Deltaproteobacteria bacterium]|nr:hypothetical protein [Deltaproteobacteria bacterium]